MWNNTNPAELFSGTTWELLTAGKYIQSGSTALQTGGNNSVNIRKEHLPNIALKVNTFSLTTKAHTHSFQLPSTDKDGGYNSEQTLVFITKECMEDLPSLLLLQVGKTQEQLLQIQNPLEVAQLYQFNQAILH